MAKISHDSIFDRRHGFPTKDQLSSLAISEFITSKAKQKEKFALNYPYNVYSAAWESSTPVRELQSGDGINGSKRCRKFWWWQPESDQIIAEFLESSSMHGLKYVSQPKRHLVERLFWLGSFLSCVIGATLMISEIWQRYYDNPVIVTFNPTEVDVDVIPFPAITICNINPFRRSRVYELEKIYKYNPNKEERDAALDALRVINGLCSAQPSFLKSLDYAQNRGKMTLPEAMKYPSDKAERNLTNFLLENTQPCKELLRICVWAQEKMDCDKLFKPIITDYGKCCTFNMLPEDLMEHHHVGGGKRGSRNSSWSEQEIEDWKKWNYDIDGYILKPGLKYPRRQRRAGTVDGLSLLVDPDVENSFCPSTDSEGIKVLYHTSLDAPRVADLGLVVGIDREVFLEVNPDLTIADDGISSYRHESRKCYFGLEYKLNFYKPYTRSNCLEECWIDILYRNCSCVLYYSPHNTTAEVCSSNPGSKHHKCIMENEKRSLGRLHRICSHCMYSCNDLEYSAEVTYAQLQPGESLWAGGKNASAIPWKSNRVSIVHIFMGADSTVPKLRQKLYQAVDLIANTGGLLGLSIGFSVLSAVEIVYFATMRLCCKRLRKSKHFGQPESTSAGEGQATQILVQSQHPRIQQNLYNRFGFMDKESFLREMDNKNLIHYRRINDGNLGISSKWHV